MTNLWILIQGERGIVSMTALRLRQFLLPRLPNCPFLLLLLLGPLGRRGRAQFQRQRRGGDTARKEQKQDGLGAGP